MNLEILLANTSFVLLFLIMIFYWLQAVFCIIPKFQSVIFIATWCANLSLLSLLLTRWITYKHFPLSNLYESLIFLSWSFTLIELVFLYKNNKTGSNLIGTIISPIALFTNCFATFSLPKTMQKAQVLVPALQSNWLMMHVTVMMLSYTALLCGSLLAISFLIVTWKKQNSTIANTLDNLSYRILGIGFPLLTIGILSGAVWANEAWGSYWSWDPKETWAFITWLIFAIYLHIRITKGWKGRKPAILASCGFFIIWICYLGVNIVGSGLHSYGWVKL